MLSLAVITSDLVSICDALPRSSRSNPTAGLSHWRPSRQDSGTPLGSLGHRGRLARIHLWQAKAPLVSDIWPLSRYPAWQREYWYLLLRLLFSIGTFELLPLSGIRPSNCRVKFHFGVETATAVLRDTCFPLFPQTLQRSQNWSVSAKTPTSVQAEALMSASGT